MATSKSAYLWSNLSREAMMRDQHWKHGSNRIVNDVPRGPASTFLVLHGEKARNLEEAIRLADGKYPVLCQWNHDGCKDPHVRVQHASDLRRLFATKKRWKQHQYLIVRPAY